MKISFKINLLSGLLLSGFLFLLGFSVFSLNTIIVSMNRINLIYAHLNSIRNCENLLVSQLAESQQIILRNKGTVDGDILISLRLKNSQLSKEIAALERSVLPEGIYKNTGMIDRFRRLYLSINENLIQRIFNREDFDTAVAFELIFSDYNDLQSMINDYQEEISEGLKRTSEANHRTQQIQIIIFSALIGIMSAAIISMIIFMRRSVLQPIRETSREMLKLADGNGNLDFRFDINGNDEIAEMGTRFNIFLEKTSDLVSRIGEAGLLSGLLGNRLEEDIRLNSTLAENLKMAIQDFIDYFSDLSTAITSIENVTGKIFGLSNHSKELVSSQETLLNRAALSVIETLEEIKTIKGRGNCSLKASEELNKKAVNGAGIIHDLDRQIEEILDSAKNLSHINEVIRDISGRTKILGVNAAIEAARAGVSGKGFKIVAGEIAALGDEVRANSVRTEESLKNVQDSITQLKQKSTNGRTMFDLIKDESVYLKEGISIITDILENHEINEKNRADNISELSESSRSIADFIIELDSGIKSIFESAKHLGGKLETVSIQAETAAESAEELNQMRQRLEQTAVENNSVAETLNDYTGHFRTGMY